MGVLFNSRIPAIIAGLEVKAAVAVQKAVEDVEAHAKENAPVDTGFLQSSIQGEMTGHLSGRVEVAAEYAEYVEHGTSKAAPQPFLTPAAEAVKPSFERAMAQIV